MIIYMYIPSSCYDPEYLSCQLLKIRWVFNPTLHLWLDSRRAQRRAWWTIHMLEESIPNTGIMSPRLRTDPSVQWPSIPNFGSKHDAMQLAIQSSDTNLVLLLPLFYLLIEKHGMHPPVALTIASASRTEVVLVMPSWISSLAPNDRHVAGSNRTIKASFHVDVVLN